ncbi:restriction endonuclease subunit S [Bacillus sp. UMB0728]|uniref:restriction endonuclease subunit S n=1 Tax=Bacillus sp. UMB0728 TaxID=2066052 RepID=UPI000C756420|nr:restriction endonuclease subunit S [Bacillus sp. UMB0728]PLR73796.1 hypothetical protein CYJ37_09780 [Bacillus sp. UMB0728]
MSKKIKNIQELLDNIMLKEDEYKKVHENWLWVRLGGVCKFKRGPFGSAIKKSMFVPKDKDTYKVYEQGNAIRKTIEYGEYYISKEDFETLKGFEVNAGDIIVSCAGTIGETYVIPSNYEKGVINQALMRVSTSKVLDKTYFLYAFDYYIKELAKDNAKGTAIKNLPPLAELKQYVIPLPPLNEQKRIAEKVEGLLNKIEEAKQLIAEAHETYKLRRAAILDNAFRGILGTNNSNEQSMITVLDNKEGKQNIDEPYQIPENWIWVTLENISDYIQRGKSPKYVDSSNVRVVSQKCVQWSGFDISQARHIDEETLKNYKQERFLQKNDLLWNSTGTGTIGRVAIIKDDLEDMVVADSHVTIVRPNNNLVNSNLLYRWLSGPYVQNKLNNSWSGSTNQVELNLTTVKQQLVPLPPLNEQERIVKKVDNLLSKLEVEQKLIDNTFSKLESIKKSILSKAIQGELGTNEPREENAIELLKEVLKGQAEIM